MTKKLQTQDSHSPKTSQDGVAIIGMSCLLPGASSVQAFWENILYKKSAITEIPPDRWDWRLFYDAEPKALDKIVSKWGGFIDPIHFDPLDFGMPPESLYSIEPLQLLTLYAVRAALDDAGYRKREFNKESCGVILGAGNSTPDLAQRYGARVFLQQNLETVPKPLLERLPEWTEDSFAGTLINVLAGRIANRFDLGGKNFTVDAACASSLAAISQAVNELETGGCDMVITGGVDGSQSPLSYMNFSKSGALSPTGTCAPFDQSGNGTVISEGIAILVLKRLSNAIKDQDRIYAVIKGVGGASDGKAKSISSPNPAGQCRALRQAYKRANISPSTVELVEAHGTGTVAGDSAELASLAEVYGEAQSKSRNCVLGSAKSVVGHTKAAAGAVGVLKSALALYHKVLPPTLGLKQPLDAVHASPFFMNNEARAWIHDASAAPRRAAVTGIGFGGTNFHAVLEEFDGGASTFPSGIHHWEGELLLIPGESAEAIKEHLRAIFKTTWKLRDLSWTLWQRIKKGEKAGAAIVALNRDDLSKKITRLSDFLEKEKGRTGIEDPSGIYFQPLSSESPGKIAFVFSGQGSQYPGMMRDLTLAFPRLRARIESADQLLRDAYKGTFSKIIYPPPAFTPEQEKEAQKNLTQTHYAQPALGLYSLNLFEILTSCGVPVHMMAGHSFGEYSALCAAGGLSRESLITLAEMRGRLMTEITAGKDMGTMAAVQAVPQEISSCIKNIPEVWITNLNSPKQTMISGSKEGIDQALAALKTAGLEAKPIRVSGGFHSPLFKEVGKAFAECLEKTAFSNLQLPVYANLTGAEYGKEAKGVLGLLKDHMVSPVQFVKQVETMYRDGARTFVEVGPKNVLCGLIGQILTGKPHTAIPMDNPRESGVIALLKGLGRLCSRGYSLNLDVLFEGRSPIEMDFADLAPAAPPPSKTAWLVNTSSAHPWSVADKKQADKPVALVSEKNVTNVFPTGELPDMNLNNKEIPLSGGASFSEVMRQHQELMKRFLESQERVMMQYLSGESLPAFSGAVPTGSNSEPISNGNAVPPSRVVPSGDIQKQQTEPPQISAPAVSARILAIVSLRTGYPDDMLDVNADLEADLSIDSIKKVEILGAIQDQLFPDGKVPEGLTAQGAARLKTLAEIIQWVTDALAVSAPIKEASPKRQRSDIAAAVLDVVSKRTGYPVDMLDPAANLEADLSIDSIKRVEILGALQDAVFPGGLPAGVTPEGVNRLDTLNAITDWLMKALEKDSGSSIASSAKEVDKPASKELRKELPRFVLRAVALDPAGLVPPSFDRSRPILITDDEKGYAPAMKTKLEALGAKTVLVRHGKSKGRSDGAVYEADLTDPKSIANLAEQIRTDHGSIGGIIHLSALREKESFATISFDQWNDRLARDIKGLFSLAKTFGKDLRESANRHPSWLLAGIQLDGSFLANAQEKEEFDPGQMGISGIVKTLGLEWSNVHCRTIDFEPSMDADARANSMIQEMSIPGFEPEVGYKQGRRFVLRVEKEALDPGKVRGPKIESDWVILVTGGARGITAEVAKELALKYKPTLVLAARSALPAAEGEETRNLQTEAELKNAIIQKMKQTGEKVLPKQVQTAVTRLLRDREILGNIEQMKASGAKVAYLSADVCNGEEFEGLIKKIYDQHQRLDLVIHGAGIIEDNLIENKTFESFCRVFDTKAQSVYWMTRALRFASLKGLILFSSVVGRFGNRGQTDYSATNEVVNKVAVYLNRRHPARVVAINFGPWASSGMVSPGVEAQLKERDVQLVPADQGRRAVDTELTLGKKEDVEIVVGDGLWRNLDDAQAALKTYHGADAMEPARDDLVETARKLGLPYLYSATWKSRSVDKSEIEVRLRINDHPYLLDHRMDRKVVIPFAVAMEIASQAAKAITGGLEVARILEFKALKGIIFDGSELNLLVTILPSENDSLEIRIALAEKAKFFTHKGIFSMSRTKSEAPAAPSASPHRTMEPFPHDVKSSYAKLLFHGPKLQTIQRFEGISPEGIAAVFRPSQPKGMLQNAKNEAWIFDPVMLDGVSQLAGLWLTARYDTTCFPSGFGSMSSYRPFDGELVICELDMKNYSGGSALHADVTFRNTAGLVFAQVLDFEFSCSKAFNRFRGTYEPMEMLA